MGLTKVTVKISNLTKSKEAYEELFLVDTGAIHCMAPKNKLIEAGIEVNACPPGKKLKNLTMLSGGEKALTSIALLSAIMANNPSPFIVLDEVDAALDEANSKKFAKILGEFTDKTQFILITHNRETMRRAAILYGVTMQRDGVSKLLSVKLDKVREDGSIAEEEVVKTG